MAVSINEGFLCECPYSQSPTIRPLVYWPLIFGKLPFRVESLDGYKKQDQVKEMEGHLYLESQWLTFMGYLSQ